MSALSAGKSPGDPHHVAELMGGCCYPFPGSIPDSFMAVSGDVHGTMVEVYLADVTLRPGEGDAQATATRKQALPDTVPFHFLLSVAAGREEIEWIGAREGWRTPMFGRGAPGQPPMFYIIELWIDSRLMVEIASQDMIGAYTDLSQSPVLDAHLATRAICNAPKLISC